MAAATHLLVDTETSGLDPSRHAILELGAIALDDSLTPVGEPLGLTVRPRPDDVIEKSALDVNGHTWALDKSSEGWAAALDRDAAAETLLCFMESAGLPREYVPLVGWNVSFDERFLRRLLGSRPWPFHFQRIEMISVVRFIDAKTGSPPRRSYKLTAVVGDMLSTEAISASKAHSALGDCQLTLGVIRALTVEASGAPARPVFTCSACGEPFTVPKAVLDKYKHWTPRECMECKRQKRYGLHDKAGT